MLIVTTRVLTDLGYKVLSASEVLEGFYLWQKHKEEIKLLITDFIFAGHLTGMDLLMKVQVREPDLPVLIVSGSWIPDARKDPPLPPNVAHLAKPFRRADIAYTVRALLDEAERKAKKAAARAAAAARRGLG